MGGSNKSVIFNGVTYFNDGIAPQIHYNGDQSESDAFFRSLVDDADFRVKGEPRSDVPNQHELDHARHDAKAKVKRRKASKLARRQRRSS
jgi:hypothetical protein